MKQTLRTQPNTFGPACSEQKGAGRLLLPAALLAASCFAMTGFFLSSPASAQEAVSEKGAVSQKEAGLKQEAEVAAKQKTAEQEAQEKAAQERADLKKAAQKSSTGIGRGRLSGKTPPPKAASVPRSSPTSAPAVKGQAPQIGPPQKPKFEPGMSAEEQKRREVEYMNKLKASQADGKGAGKQPGGKYGAAPRPPRNPNAKLDVEFGAEKHDFGRARQGDQLTHVFKMKSSGSEPLIITQASPTCGCTLGEVKVRKPGDETSELYRFGDPIEVGADVELAATLDTGSKRNDTQVRIQVYSNDGKAPTTTLTLKASIQPFIVATPPYLQLGDIREGTERTAKINFRTSSGEPILLSSDTLRKVPVPEGMTVSVDPVNPNAEGKSSQWAATFVIGSGAKEGPGGFMLRMNSDVELPQSKKAKSLTAAEEAKAAAKGAKPTVYTCDANISYNVIGALSMAPLYISLGLVRPGQAVVRSARLTSHESDFDLSGVKVVLVGEGNADLKWADQFVASVKPVAGGSAVDIELRLTGLPESADGAFRGRVKITTGHPTTPELFLRFSGVCRKLAAGAVPKRPVTPAKGVVERRPSQLTRRTPKESDGGK